MNLTHKELVERGARWLRSSATYHNEYGSGKYVKDSKCRCSVVLCEPSGGGGVIPDVIGWAFSGTNCFVLECKASRADFLADKNKTHRQYDDKMQLGDYRIFFCNDGIATAADVADPWGLVVVKGRCCKVLKAPKRIDRGDEYSWGKRYEASIVISELAKIQMVWRGEDLWTYGKRGDLVAMAKGVQAAKESAA